MDMNMNVIQGQASATASQAVAAAVSGSTEQAGGGAFEKLLLSIVGQAETESTVDNELIAAMLAAGAISPSVLNAILPQADMEQLKQDLAKLLTALTSGDTEAQQQLLSHPAMQQLLAHVDQLQTDIAQTAAVHTGATASATAAQNGVQLTANHSVQSLLAMVTEALKHGSITSTDVQQGSHNAQLVEAQTALLQLLQKLVTGTDAKALQAASPELQAALQELNQAFPALFAKLADSKNDAGSATNAKSQQSAVHVLANAIQPGGSSQQQSQSFDSKGNDAGNARGQMLERLSFMKPIVHIVGVEQEQTQTANNVVQLAAQSVEAVTVGKAEAVSSQADTMTQQGMATDLTKGFAAASSKATSQQTTVYANNFAADMTKFMVKNLSITQLGGMSEARISLAPEHLGQLNVKISVVNGQITASFIAETMAARELLENQLPQLRAALQQQGLHVDKLAVTHNQGMNSGMFHDGRGGFSNGQQSGSGQSQRSMGANGVDFAAEIEQAGLLDEAAGYGSTFHASA